MPGRPGFATSECRRTDLAGAFGISEILLATGPKSVIYPDRPVPKEGRVAIVTAAGRDAVDAEAPITNGAEADGKDVWS
jgi:hypothetical protein